MPRFLRLHFLFVFFLLAIIGQWGCVPSQEQKTRQSQHAAKIVVDPGHGGQDAGASLKGAPHEKDVVLDIALQVERLLKQKGLDVILTRRTDEFIPLWKRAGIANDDHATLLVSIHANSCHQDDVNGFEIYYTGDGEARESLEAATFIQRSLKAATNARDRGIRKHSYAVLSRTKCASVLIEVGYLSNRREAMLLSRRSYRKRVARGIAKGIIAYTRARP